MKNDQLIQALVADVRPVRRLPRSSLRCARWLSLALTLAVAGAALWGLRPDLAQRTRDPQFLLENAVLLLAFVLAARSAFELSVPADERSTATFALPWLGVLLWLVLILARGGSGVDAGDLELAARAGIRCVGRILGLGLLPLLTCWGMLRRASPQLEGWVGLFLSLSAFSLAALGTQTLCAVDEPLHVLCWHCLPVLLLGFAGGGLGRVAFRKRGRAIPEG